MNKRHREEEGLQYMKMLEEGYGVSYISKHYGINNKLLRSLWIRYHKDGPLALKKSKILRQMGV